MKFHCFSIKKNTATNMTNKDNGINVKEIKQRLSKHIKTLDAKNLPQNIIDYIEHDIVYDLSDIIKYIEKIQSSEYKIDCIIEKIQKYKNKLGKYKLEDVDEDVFYFISKLVILGELDIAYSLYEELLEIDGIESLYTSPYAENDVYFELHAMYLYFTPQMRMIKTTGKILDLRARLVKAAKEIDPEHLSKNVTVYIKYFSYKYFSYKKWIINIKKIQSNPEDEIDKLILQYLTFNIDYEKSGVEWYDDVNVRMLKYFVIYGELDIVYEAFKKHSTSDIFATKSLYTIYRCFADWCIKKKGPDVELTILRQDLQLLSRLSLYQVNRVLKLCDTRYQRSKDAIVELENTVIELKDTIFGLKDQIIDLTYRPGGPGFKEAQTRQIGSYGLKK